MSERAVHDLSLRALASEMTRQAALLKGAEPELALYQGKRVADLYCKRMNERWNISMTPQVSWNPETLTLSLGAEPESDLDDAMLQALMTSEGLQ